MDYEGRPGVLDTLDHLIVHGWIPLRKMSALLSLKTPTAIYQRQRGRSAINTIKVGGQYRVYEEEVIRILEKEPEHKQIEAQYTLGLYRTKQKQQDNEE